MVRWFRLSESLLKKVLVLRRELRSTGPALRQPINEINLNPEEISRHLAASPAPKETQ
jgi:hypothetical protein